MYISIVANSGIPFKLGVLPDKYHTCKIPAGEGPECLMVSLSLIFIIHRVIKIPLLVFYLSSTMGAIGYYRPPTTIIGDNFL